MEEGEIVGAPKGSPFSPAFLLWGMGCQDITGCWILSAVCLFWTNKNSNNNRSSHSFSIYYLLATLLHFLCIDPMRKVLFYPRFKDEVSG